jgi:hypothetical protein
MGKFISILKVILQVGGVALPVVLNTVSPGLGTLVSTVLNSILASEGKLGAGAAGPDKLQYALELVQSAVPGIVQLIEVQTGKRLTDQNMFAEGVRDLTNALVKLLNSFGLMPSETKPATAGPLG